MFFRIQFQRKPAHDRKHPHRKQVSVRTVTFRGPGAGICRRQLRWHPKSTKWRQKVENVRCWYGFFMVFFQTLFSRNHSNPCAVGTSWLLKGHFFDGDWLICCFGCVSLCSVLYNIFITLFHKTLVNAQPLSPPFFEEIAAHKEIYVSFSFVCLRLRLFSNVSYFC